MQLLNLFLVASTPVFKVLIVTALGTFLALDCVDVLGESARKQLNRVVFFVFNPALVGGNLASTITSENVVLLWFMPVNILLTFIIGSALGWILVKVTRPQKHLKGLVLGCCAAGNLGNLPLIMVTALCKEKGNPFGSVDVCVTNGIAYVSLSMAIGAVYLWSYVYNLVRFYSADTNRECDGGAAESTINTMINEGTPILIQEDYHEALLPSKDDTITTTEPPHKWSKVPILDKIRQGFSLMPDNLNLKKLFSPSTNAAIVGFFIGVFSPIRRMLIGAGAPLHVFEDSASFLGDATIPTVTLIAGANLLRGLKGSGIQLSVIVGILAVRYALLPLSGVAIVKAAIRFGLVSQDDRLYQFILLLQFALPPAMNIGTITQLFGAGESECSVIMLWTYALAAVALTLWSTFFMWLVT